MNDTAKGKERSDLAIGKSQKPRPLSYWDDLENWFEEGFPRGWMHRFGWDRPAFPELMSGMAARVPKVDLIDRENEIALKAEVPGVAKEDIEVSVSDNAVTLKGTTHHEEKEEKGNYYRTEISKGAFTRTVTLPCDVDSDKATAKMSDGVLEIVLPKVERAKRKTVSVK